MVERSQKDVWRLTPWLMIALLLVQLHPDGVRRAGDQFRPAGGSRLDANRRRFCPVAGHDDHVLASQNYFTSISNLRSAQSENDILKQRVQELEVELKQKEDLAARKRPAEIAPRPQGNRAKYKVLTARIIGRDPSVWFDSSIINRGSLDGVKLEHAGRHRRRTGRPGNGGRAR